MGYAQEISAEVEKRLAESSPEVLGLFLDRIERYSSNCHKHQKLMRDYVLASIKLSKLRAHDRYLSFDSLDPHHRYRSFDSEMCMSWETESEIQCKISAADNYRYICRQAYRLESCTCTYDNRYKLTRRQMAEYDCSSLAPSGTKQILSDNQNHLKFFMHNQ